jgi:hypothetical protein
LPLHVENFYPQPTVFEEVGQAFVRGAILAIYDPYVHYGPLTNTCEIYVSMPTDIEVLPRQCVDVEWKFACRFVRIAVRRDRVDPRPTESQYEAASGTGTWRRRR